MSRKCSVRSSGRAASRFWTDAAVMTTSGTSPVLSTAMWRLRLLTFLAASQPGVAFGTVSGGADGLGVDAPHSDGQLTEPVTRTSQA